MTPTEKLIDLLAHSYECIVYEWSGQQREQLLHRIESLIMSADTKRRRRRRCTKPTGEKK